MSDQIPPDQAAAIQDALFRGRKIEAIKLYRESRSVGLAEAKSEVDKLEARLRQESPDRFQAAPAGKGCLGITVGVVLLVAGATVLLWLTQK